MSPQNSVSPEPSSIQFSDFAAQPDSHPGHPQDHPLQVLHNQQSFPPDLPSNRDDLLAFDAASNAVVHAASSTSYDGLPSRPMGLVSHISPSSHPSHSSEAQPDELSTNTAHESSKTIADTIQSPLPDTSSSPPLIETDHSTEKVIAPQQSESHLITGAVVEPSPLKDAATSAAATGDATGAESEAVVADDVATEMVVDSIPNRNYGANKLGREQYGLSLGDR